MTAARSITRLRQSLPGQHPNPKATSFAGAAAVTVGALAALALVNRYFAKKAVHDNPPAGRFLDLNGVRIHYVERGSGEPLVLLHGNGSMIQDFESSGLIDLAAKSYRVIVFDRPGFGHSDRPRNVVWTPDSQAELFKEALARLRISNAIILGHSWGASIAVAPAATPEIARPGAPDGRDERRLRPANRQGASKRSSRHAFARARAR